MDLHIRATSNLLIILMVLVNAVSSNLVMANPTKDTQETAKPISNKRENTAKLRVIVTSDFPPHWCCKRWIIRSEYSKK